VTEPKELSVAEAKASFSSCIRDAESGQSILITRHGKPVVVLVRAEYLEQLERLRAAGPEGGLASLAGGWEGSDEFADLVESTRRTRPRKTPSFD
jgi:prevent-host-death family protein